MSKNKKNIEKKIIEVASKVFKMKKSNLSLSTSSKNIPQWDSLNNVNLMIELKKQFKINFKIEEIAEINSLKQWHSLIIKK